MITLFDSAAARNGNTSASAALASPAVTALLAGWKAHDVAAKARAEAAQARKLSSRDFGRWVELVAGRFEALDHDAGRMVARTLNDLAAEVKFMGRGEPISASEFDARRDVQLGWLADEAAADDAYCAATC
jgi:hypothetical protein